MTLTSPQHHIAQAWNRQQSIPNNRRWAVYIPSNSKKVQGKTMAQSEHIGFPRDAVQKSAPDEGDIDRRLTGQRRLSLMRSNAVSHRKAESSNDPADDSRLSFLPQHWLDIEPQIRGVSEEAGDLGKTRRGSSKVNIFHNGKNYTYDETDNPFGNSLGAVQNQPGSHASEHHPRVAEAYDVCPTRSQPHTDSELEKVTRALEASQARVQALENENNMLRTGILEWFAKHKAEKPERYPAGINVAFTEPSAKRSTVGHDTRGLEHRANTLEKEVRHREELLMRIFYTVNGPIGQRQTGPKDYVEITENIMRRLQGGNELLSLLGSALTPRGILLLKTIQYHQPDNHLSSTLPSRARFHHPDKVLDSTQAADFARSVDARPGILGPDEVSFRVCALCHVPRFLRGLSKCTAGPYRDSEFEYSKGATNCCSQPICDACFLPSIVSSITNDWWHDLGSNAWLRCPTPSCRAPLPFQYNVELTNTLRNLRDDKCLIHVSTFERASRLRAALELLEPRPTPEALRRAAELHTQLEKHGRMRGLLNLSLCPSLAIEMMSVDSTDGSRTLQVPIFVGQFLRTGHEVGLYAAPRECTVCAEALSDVVLGDDQADEDRWAAAVRDFPGDWTCQIRAFPPPSALPACSAAHNLDICRTCLGRHLATQLDTRGRAACESLGCPTPGCGHIYTHDEIRLLAPAETFAMYDKLRLLSHLATLPNFRWCLREGCEMGQIHEIPDQMGDGPLDCRRNCVQCDVCGFDMCFRHQVPWHRGQSCAEYEAAGWGQMGGGGGNPEMEATQEWLRTHTKQCRCGARVEKEGGCFHMTCRVCSFEFCWECMADWSRIIRRNPITGQGRYDRNGHIVGCWFRSEMAPYATMVRGNTVEEALGRANRGV
ncbi:hypothetical protein B0H66DRAFT_560739 [Apodospora peruviana]|uniref:RBR-type E3 ubiquitin transferase n=1 Tax=Apodospora peruviana TaxID=516989 RepID=A0AAE0I0G8_9PEZI|nr:hypothetical protein B0H66DRAFT_560739 [Apodospora peruviana]